MAHVEPGDAQEEMAGMGAGLPDEQREENWCDSLAMEFIEAWPFIESEAGVIAQNEQNAEAGQRHAKEVIAGMIERAWNRSTAGAVPVDLYDLLDQAQATQRDMSALLKKCEQALTMAHGYLVGNQATDSKTYEVVHRVLEEVRR